MAGNPSQISKIDSKRIIAKKVVIIQKRGITRIEYTHVTHIGTSYLNDEVGDVFVIVGEINDTEGSRIKSYDTFLIANLELMIVDWYIPKI